MLVIYGRDNCIWCERAVEFAENANMEYDYKKFGIDYTRSELVELIGTEDNLTVPQIFINGTLIGGYNQFVEYHMKGETNG